MDAQERPGTRRQYLVKPVGDGLLFGKRRSDGPYHIWGVADYGPGPPATICGLPRGRAWTTELGRTEVPTDRLCPQCQGEALSRGAAALAWGDDIGTGR